MGLDMGNTVNSLCRARVCGRLPVGRQPHREEPAMTKNYEVRDYAGTVEFLIECGWSANRIRTALANARKDDENRGFSFGRGKIRVSWVTPESFVIITN